MSGDVGCPIAVVGIGCVLPDAIGERQFWDNASAGRSALRPLADGAVEWSAYFDADDQAEDRFHSLIAGVVRDYKFDWKTFRIPPADVEQINPMQLMIIDAGAQALDAVKRLPKETSGVIIGATGLGWQRDSGLRIRLGEMLDALAASPGFAALPAHKRETILAAARRGLEQRLRPVSEDNVVNASASVAAGRINMHFDLRGPHFAVDAGFASSLAALDTGVRLLRDHTLDLALVGGASEILTPIELVAFSKLGGLARTRLAAFDAAAEGTLLGEGTALFALKRLDDALRDGEKIRAVILGVGGSTDGRGKALVAPLADGQALAMRRAYADAGISAATVGFVECHATGTQVGDVSEVRALAGVYGAQPHKVALGSAKPMVGHLRGAAGAVGLLRAILALEHKQIPAQLDFHTANPALELETTPFFIPRANVPLAAVGGASAARAAVSAFGFGGNSFHAVLEAFDAGAARAPSRASTRPARAPIAIVGMGGSFPNGNDVPTFWQALLDGKDATREIPPERWSIDRHYDPNRERRDTSYTRLGCFLDRLPTVEPRWRIPPAAQPTIDPGQLLMLRAAEEAVADAGIDVARWQRDRVGVMLAFLPYQGKKFLADIRVNFRELALELSRALTAAGIADAVARAIVSETERRFKAGLPAITEDTMTGYLGSINAARVARHFDLRGPHFVVDSACASTHAALLASMNALRQGSCDYVLSGGVWVDMQPEFFIAACRFQALSAIGSRPFSDGADGFIPGEGGGIFVLRRLADAERDGQRVHAVLRAVAGSSDGRGRSVLAPKPEGEAMAMQRALAEAEVRPDEVDYVECHGTGTALGDLTELDACSRAYGEGRARPLMVGSVKSNIGHLNAAAGVPALMKVVMALETGLLPASLKAQPFNAKIDFTRGPIAVVTETTPWPNSDGKPRRAGVSGFGVGGSNMHMIVEQHRPRPNAKKTVSGDDDVRSRASSPATLMVAAAQAADLPGCITRLQTIAKAAQGLDGEAYRALLAESQDNARATSGQRVAIVAPTAEELARRVELLRSMVARGSSPSLLQAQGVFVGRPDARLKVAVAFPGQGPQYANMLRAALPAFPAIRHTLDEIDAAYRALCGRPLSPAFLVDDAEHWQQPDEDIHCAVYAVNCALYRVLVDHGLSPDAAMGQSAGDLAALVAAGSLSLTDGLRAMRERTLAVLRLDTRDPGRMVALACGAERAAMLLRDLPGYAALAADNSPAACIVSADRAALPELMARAANDGIEATQLAVSHGYHSQLIAGARAPYRRELAQLHFSAPRFEVVSSITGQSMQGLAPADFAAQLERQYVEPVRLRQAVETLYASGVRLFIECGPKWPLTTFIGQILGSRPHVTQATLHPKVGEVEQLTRALACLYVHGAGELRPVARAKAAPRAGKKAPRRDDVLELLRNVHQLIGDFIARYDDAPEAADAPEAENAPDATDRFVDAPLEMPMAAAPVESVAAPAPAPIASAPTSDTAEAVSEFFIAKLVEKTGYPEEMLDPTLDLEADLGIDTVKQLAIMSETRAHFGLEVDPRAKLRDFNTIAKFVTHLTARIDGETAAATSATAAAPAPTVAAPTAAATAATTKSGADEIAAFFTAKLVEKTGYPEEMLDPTLDLEADLGIDTVKQVAIMSETRTHFGLDVDPTAKLRDFNTIAKFVAHLAGRLGSARGTAAKIEVEERPHAAARPGSFDEVRAVFVAKLVEKTGYPEDMLDLDLDLEADLGIDTVKQLAIMSESRAHFGLDIDTGFKLRDHNTIRKFVTYLVRRIGGPTPSGGSNGNGNGNGGKKREPSGGKSRSDGGSSLASFERRAGDAGTVRDGEQQRLSERACLQLLIGGAHLEGEELTIEQLIVGAPALLAPSLTLHARAMGAGRFVLDSPLGVHVEARLANAPAGAPPPPLRAEVRAALDRRGRPCNGRALTQALARPEDGAALHWMGSPRFDEAVGAARLPEGDELAGAAAIELVAFAIDGAFAVAAAGWQALGGASFALAGLESARFFRLPRAGEELLFHAVLRAPVGGVWRADVSIHDAEMQPCAELIGLGGRPGVSAGALTDAAPQDGAPLAWQHVVRRLRTNLVEGEDHSW